jgi:LIM and senescent cell antigen-like-containing domain protein 1/2
MADVDSLMAELGLEPDGSPSVGAAPVPVAAPAAVSEVDALMGELGVSVGGPAATPPGAYTPPPAAAPASSSEPPSEVDSLMAELGVGPTPGASAPAAMGMGMGLSSGPGRGRGLSSGPGAAFAGKKSAPAVTLIPIAQPGQERIIGPGGKEVGHTTPDGKNIDWKGPQCARCNNFIAGSVLGALDKSYHVECFVCTTCQQPFANGGFLEHEGKPYCENDYNAMFCPTCHLCKQPITAKCVTAGDMKFHPQHFACTGCGTDLLAAGKHEVLDDHVYCLACFGKNVQRKENPRHTCGKCKLPITGEFIIFNNQPVHSEHFQCEECGKDFKGNGAREWEGGLFCLECYKLLIIQKCGGCNKPIKGRSITALGRVWHPEHFVCATCHDPFAEGAFFEHEGKPYCEQHYTQDFGERCAKCQQPVATDTIHFEGKAYHREHFCCHGCEKTLTGKKTFCWESKPMCQGCFNKLPEAVRKRIKKLAQEKAKAEKARQKAAKKAAKG